MSFFLAKSLRFSEEPEGKAIANEVSGNVSGFMSFDIFFESGDIECG